MVSKKYRNRLVFPFIIVVLVVAVLLSIKIINNSTRITRRPPPQDASLYDKWFKQVFLQKFMSNSISRVNLQHCDLTELDLSDKFNILINSEFDTQTKWPKSLPQSFNPTQVMEAGKNPGLDIRSLHNRGINGKNIGIAIIDNALLVDHIEYKKRLRLYEEINGGHGDASMHGPAMSSLAIGKDIGTAPEANLYFIGTSNIKPRKTGDIRPRFDFSNYATAINRILDINKGLPKSKKIRVISISASWAPENNGYKEINEAVKKAKANGIFVISGNLDEIYNYKFFFHGLDRDPLKDSDGFSSYKVIPWDEWISLLDRRRFPEFIALYEDRFDRNKEREILLIPIYSRTYASQNGKKEYTFSRGTGWSMCPPYLAGIYALACQVKADITPDIFWEIALETGEQRVIQKDDKKFRGKIINPVKLIQAIGSQIP